VSYRTGKTFDFEDANTGMTDRHLATAQSASCIASRGKNPTEQDGVVLNDNWTAADRVSSLLMSRCSQLYVLRVLRD